MRACVRARMRACVHACMHACLCVYVCVMYVLPVQLLVIQTACNDCYCHFLLEVSQHGCSLYFNFVQLTEEKFFMLEVCAFISLLFRADRLLCMHICACMCVCACVCTCVCAHVVCVEV